MSSAPFSRPYFDSAIFISWVKGSDEGPLADGSVGNRTPVSEHVMRAAESGDYPLITSFFTMAEVFKKKGDGRVRLTDDENGRIVKYFENEFIVWVELDRNVGLAANKLLIDYSTEGLRPADAIHLASALQAKCDVLLTWDVPLLKVQHQGIRIEFPQIYVAPPTYRTPPLFDAADDVT